MMYSRSASNSRGFSVWHTAPMPLMAYLQAAQAHRQGRQVSAEQLRGWMQIHVAVRRTVLMPLMAHAAATCMAGRSAREKRVVPSGLKAANGPTPGQSTSTGAAGPMLPHNNTHQASRWRTVLKASVATRSPGLWQCCSNAAS